MQSDRPQPEQEAETPARRRPRDRKAQIATAAARAFSDRGYHPVGVDDIAAQLGISGPAIYRHFPNKYALLVAAADNEVGALGDAVTTVREQCPAGSPAETLSAVVRALSRATIEHRRSGGLYRWEGRYLEPPDRARLRETFDMVTRAIADPIAKLRPELAKADVQMLATGVLSVIGSITAHRTAAPAEVIETQLCQMCAAVVATELPPQAQQGSGAAGAEPGMSMTARRERILNEAIRTFAAAGYHDTSIEQIAAAAGITASSLYRYFTSKADLLAAAFYRAGDRVSATLADALAASTDSRTALAEVAGSYLALAFANHELMSVYFAEFGNLPAADQSRLRAIQRQNIEEWVHLLVDLRPGQTEARFRVHAALGLVLDVGRLVRFDTRAASRARVHALMRAVLLAPTPATPTTTDAGK